MNLVLLQNGYPIAILKGDTQSRLQYYAALEVAQTTGDKQPFLLLIIANVKDALERVLKVVGE
jgi:Fic family protein